MTIALYLKHRLLLLLWILDLEWVINWIPKCYSSLFDFEPELNELCICWHLRRNRYIYIYLNNFINESRLHSYYLERVPKSVFIDFLLFIVLKNFIFAIQMQIRVHNLQIIPCSGLKFGQTLIRTHLISFTTIIIWFLICSSLIATIIRLGIWSSKRIQFLL